MGLHDALMTQGVTAYNIHCHDNHYTNANGMINGFQEFPRHTWLLAGFLAIVTLVMAGCANHKTLSRHPRPTPSLSSLPTVEQHLLSTVKQAEALEPGNPLLTSSLYSLANYYQDQKQFEQAATQYQRLLDLKEDQMGPNHPDLAILLKRYAQVLHQANRHSEAKSLTARANAIMAQSSKPSKLSTSP